MTNAIEGEANDGLPAELSGRPRSPKLGGSIGATVRSATGLLARFLARIVNGIRCIAPLALGLACQSTNDIAAVAPPAASIAPAPAEPPHVDAGPRQLGQFTITFYYVVGEDEIAAKPAMVASNDNRTTGDGPGGNDSDASLAAISSDRVTLFSGGGGCPPIAEVSKDFAAQLALQGTGKLRDGRVVNIFGACNCKRSPCFKVTQAQWGTSGSGKPLQPFRTVAVDPKVVKLGSLLYVPLLEGRLMPGRAPWGGYVHDGCVA
jgi:hypothetical protein